MVVPSASSIEPGPPRREVEQNIGFESALSDFQHPDERQVSVSLLVIEAIPDDELILDIEPDIIRLNRQSSVFHFPQKDTAFHA